MNKNKEKSSNRNQNNRRDAINIGAPLFDPRYVAHNNAFQHIPLMNFAWPTQNIPSSLAHQTLQQEQYNKKICLFCKNEPKFTCSRCDGFYCSNECQRNDWNRHRYFCFHMPSLVPIKTKNRTAPPIAMLPKNQSNVKVTGFRRTNLCYIRSVDKTNDDNFKKGCNDIMNFGKTAQPMTELPQPNTYALTYYNEFYYRVQILSSSSIDKIRVLFIDIGNVKTVPLQNLRNISSCIINILQHAVAIKLKGVQNYIMSEDEMEKFLRQFCDTEFILEYSNDEEDDEKEYTLKSLYSDTTLNELISTLCSDSHIKLDIYKDDKLRPVDERTKAIQNTFTIEKFQIGRENFVVVILNNSDIKNGVFGCIERCNKIFLDKARRYLNSYDDDLEAYAPEAAEYCLANVERKWCRVKVLSIFGKIYTVINMDTTQEYKTTRNQLRRYPEDFKVPCKTVKCKFDGIQSNNQNKEIDEYLQSNFSLNSIKRIMKVTKIENNMTYVKMDDYETIKLYFGT